MMIQKTHRRFACLFASLILCAPACLGDGDGPDGDEPGSSSRSTGGKQPSALTPKCSDYCAAIMTNCDAHHKQYGTMENCMNSCSAFPAGTTSDANGDTLGCRFRYAGAPAKSDPAASCAKAGPGGGGVCGSVCQGYCDIAMKFCVGAAKVYENPSDCMATCTLFPNPVNKAFNVDADDGNNASCLLNHAQDGSTVPMDHCLGDLAKTSTLTSKTCHD